MNKQVTKQTIYITIIILFIALLLNTFNENNDVNRTRIKERELSINITSLPRAINESINQSIHKSTNKKSNKNINTIFENFYPSLWLRKQFDSILVKTKNSEPKQLKHLTELHHQMRLSKEGYKSLVSLFQRYLKYKLKTLSEKNSLAANDSLAQVDVTQQLLDILAYYQGKYFSQDEIDAFFGNEMRFHQQALSRIAIVSDNSLSRTQALDVLEAEIRTQDTLQQEAFLPSINVERMSYMLSGNSEYLPKLSPEAEERFLNFKAENNKWQRRVNDYIKKSKIINDNELDSEIAKKSIKALRISDFNSDERKRLDVFVKYPELIKLKG